MAKKETTVTAPATLEEALAQIELLNSANAELTAANTTLSAELKTAKQSLSISSEHNDAANALVEDLRADLSKADDFIKQKLADKDAAIAELNNVIAELRATPAPGTKPTFTLEGKTYAINAASFLHKRETVTAAELCSNTALQAELVAKQIGFITEITD